MSWPAYPEYKDSGVMWLGQIPEHWMTPRLSHITTCFDSIRIPLNSSERADVPGEVPYWGANGIVGSVDRPLISGPLVLLGEDGAPFFDRLKDKAFFVDEPIWPNNHIHVLRSSPEVYAKYLTHALNATDYSSSVEGSTRDKLTQSSMKSIPISLPPLAEQKCIVSFLDRETGNIDALIDKQHQLIATLREDRTATITHAVTKGLNPDAEMKDVSLGLPEVPHDWIVAPAKRFLVSLNNMRIPLSTTERGSRQGDYPYYGASGVIDYVDDYIFNEELVLVSEDGANLITRRTPISFTADGEYWVNNHAHILKPVGSESSKFWAYRIESENVSPYVTGAAQPKFTSEALMNLPVSTPHSAADRDLIVEYITSRCRPIDLLLLKSSEVIDTLKEYRSALITAAVTGKIDVREAV